MSEKRLFKGFFNYSWLNIFRSLILLEYKTILRPFDFAALIGDVREKSAIEAAIEAEGWNTSLNKYAKDGWIVKSAGPIVSGNDLVLWALLERPERKEGF
jgi:hypothetical protein